MTNSKDFHSWYIGHSCNSVEECWPLRANSSFSLLISDSLELSWRVNSSYSLLAIISLRKVWINAEVNLKNNLRQGQKSRCLFWVKRPFRVKDRWSFLSLLSLVATSVPLCSWKLCTEIALCWVETFLNFLQKKIIKSHYY